MIFSYQKYQVKYKRDLFFMLFWQKQFTRNSCYSYLLHLLN